MRSYEVRYIRKRQPAQPSVAHRIEADPGRALAGQLLLWSWRPPGVLGRGIRARPSMVDGMIQSRFEAEAPREERLWPQEFWL
jgi:hypothetical protein